MQNRPRARKTFTSGGGSGVHKTGSGHGGGPVGGGSMFGQGSGQSGGFGGNQNSGSGGQRGGGRMGCLPIIIIAILALVGGGGALGSGLFGGGGGGGSSSNIDISDLQSMLNSGSGVTSAWTASESNDGTLNTEVAPEARDRFTTIYGNGKDKTTILVYMCGADLESRSGMATNDLNEMLQATVGNNINLVVYTGGCRQWRNNLMSSKTNQIYQIQNGNIKCLVSNAGNYAMTDIRSLQTFLNWGKQNFPANRMDLIFWDHGGGSITGYGYDEKYASSGSMTLEGINQALKSSGIKFDFIGFDTCLMATAENALMLSKYADYMVASEETEPGIGWYYTNWLSKLSQNPSMPTLEIGKSIVDDFTTQCAKTCRGQSTTLSVIDLAELGQTLPAKLSAFSADTGNMISGGQFKTVANARSSSKEFARSSAIDQIDLVHFAKNLNTAKSKELAQTLLNAIKYNRIGSTSNAYGLSIYFPYNKINKVDTISKIYDSIGMDKEYTSCMKKFATMGVSGHAVSSGSSSPLGSLLGGSYGGSQSSSGMSSSDMTQLIGALMGGGSGGSSYGSGGVDISSLGNLLSLGLNKSNTAFLSESGLDPEEVAGYIEENLLSIDDLNWTENSDGDKCISLSEDKWELIQGVDMAMFYDDGDGYIDLGLDNIYDFDEEGNLLPNLEKTWLALDDQIVSYYHTETIEYGNDKYSITGYVPALLNGERVKLILTFDDQNEQGYVSGVSYDYDEETSEVEGKLEKGLNAGDKLEFLCDYYSYSGDYRDNYTLGDKAMTVSDPAGITIHNLSVGQGKVKIAYRFTDIYGQEYWSPALSL
ncbi:MAG: peptidase C11 [Firmicutes bacterium]|nr:peptidase C11 [Bacillota bacterium]